MKLSIIIVSWNVRADIINCLGSIYKNPSSSPFEVILIDNASSDKTVECIQKEFSQVVCIANNDNRGFAGANNQGIEIAKGEYLLFLNPDTIIHKGTLDYLVDFMDNNKEAGACGPQLLNEDGSIQRSVRRFPSFRGALYRFTFLKYFKIFKKDYRNWLARDFDHKSQIEVDQLMGAALLVRKSITDNIGGFDERYFMYYEEVDLCCRIKHDGWQIVFLPQVRITHLGGRSSQQIPAAKRIMMLRSMLKYFRKHRGIGITFLFNCFFKIGVLLREIVDLAIKIMTYFFALLLFNKKKTVKTGKKIVSSAMFTLRFVALLFKI
ncbi:MAG: glycosyltransferase family 2 protein [Phycisphaerae bacterium]|nr:glycosyltransferase family 2 protein [Phycisphaerae bacterium]